MDERVIQASKTPYIHYAHDTWTDTSRRNCYIGIYAYWLDEDFKLQSLLLRFMHLCGSQAGASLGDALLSVFSTMGVADRLRPGTGDNASNNRSGAIHLASRLEEEEGYHVDGCHIVGCMCHIVNLAAQDFLQKEGEYDRRDRSKHTY